MSDYATLSELEDLSETDVTVDKNTFRIKAASLRELVQFETLDQGPTAEVSETMEDLLYECVLKPELENREDVEKLGRFQLPLFNEILEFSMGGMDLEDLAEEAE